MIEKLIILSSKTRNMKTVIENMVYGANARRPEQRGILSVSPGDIILLYDIDRRMLIGPFKAVDSVARATLLPWPEWSKHNWNFIVGFEPLFTKIGVLQGRGLLDLIVDAGRLSLRDRSALEAFWVNTLIAGEAAGFFNGFLSRARFQSLDKLVIEYYNTRPRQRPEIEAASLPGIVCSEIQAGRRGGLGEWVVEAALIASSDAPRLTVGDPNATRAAGVYLYGRRFLDVVYLGRYGVNAVVEVKREIRGGSDLEAAVDQAAYYGYSLARGLGIPQETLQVIVAFTMSPLSAERLSSLFSGYAREKSLEYGLRDDMFTLARVEVVCPQETMLEVGVDILG
ncbi:MAG: hypothetical protein GSR78_00465 [Desulfurococcales archaeon]|nr:hypothetical protein [Desulfurococcales archaeon]